MQFKITNPNHKLFGKVGTVTRVDVEVEGWFSSVKLADGEFVSAQQGVAAELLPPETNEAYKPKRIRARKIVQG